MTTIETTKSFDAVNSSEFVDASKDKKFGKETKEKIEKEDVKRLMKALKSVGEKQPKDGSVKMLKSILGVTDKDPTDQAVETARETIKKAHMTVEEVTKKIADKKTEQEKLEGVKNVLVEYVGKT
jgi:lipopolysaccharide biosynthesis regulator YciM